MFCEADASLLFWLMILRVRAKRLHILCILMSKIPLPFISCLLKLSFKLRPHWKRLARRVSLCSRWLVTCERSRLLLPASVFV